MTDPKIDFDVRVSIRSSDLKKLKATATRLRELLKRAKPYLAHDDECTHHTIQGDWCDCLLRVVLEDLAKELADD